MNEEFKIQVEDLEMYDCNELDLSTLKKFANFNYSSRQSTPIVILVSEKSRRSVERKRSFLERLFSWPWNPFKSTKVEEEPCAYLIEQPSIVTGLSNSRILVIHPDLRESLSWSLDLPNEGKNVRL
jgi:hypothetical protein